MPTQYCVVLPIEEMRYKSCYEAGAALPLHVTVMPWFTLPEHATERGLYDELGTCADSVKDGRIRLVSKEPARFGKDEDVPVHVLECNPALEDLHATLFEKLALANSLPEDLSFIGAGYQPHASDTPNRCFLPGDSHDAKHLVLIRRDDEGRKEVVERIILGRPSEFRTGT